MVPRNPEQAVDECMRVGDHGMTRDARAPEAGA
jgi:hypothetical protein